MRSGPRRTGRRGNSAGVKYMYYIHGTMYMHTCAHIPIPVYIYKSESETHIPVV